MNSVVILKLNGWPETFDERIEAIARETDEVILVRPSPRESKRTLDEAVTVYDLLPKRGSYIQPSWLKPIFFFLHVIQAVFIISYIFSTQTNRPDAIHALDYALGGFAGALVSQLFSVPLVVSVRGLKEPRYKNIAEETGSLKASLSYRILIILTQFVLARADHVITKAPYQVKFVRETFGVNPGFTTLPTGVDFDLFDPESVSNERALHQLLSEENAKVSSDDRIILYLAKILPEKGADRILELLTETVSRLPDEVLFAFVGEFRDDEFERRFRELQSKVRDRTALYPRRVPFETVPSLLLDADSVILLSESGTEGTPRILQESCAMGTPIIASDVDGITGGFEGLPGCYLIDRNDPEEFMNAVQSVISDPPELPRERFAERFDMYQNYARYADIYATLGVSD